MSVLISGSIAYDTILAFDGRFADHLHAGAIASLNLTFPTNRMRREFGGCAGNIAYSLKLLGGEPLLWSAMGSDAAPYMARFRSLGISTVGLKILPDAFCPQAFITTDADGNQLCSFHGGAMDRTQEVPWPELGPGDSPITLAMLSPGGRIAMPIHAAMCRERGIPYILDIGQAAPLFSADELSAMIEGAAMLAFSDYEAEILRQTVRLTPKDMAAAGKAIFHTHGSKGSSVWLPHAETSAHVEALRLPEDAAEDPVGAGDAYRGGLLYGLTHGIDPVRAARIASIMGAVKAASAGAQNYRTTIGDVRAKYEEMWREAAPF